MLYVIVVAVD